MPMTKDDLSRKFFLDVTADGTVLIRKRGQTVINNPGLPVFSTETLDEAEQLRVRHCRLCYDSEYRLNEPPKDVEDLGRVSDLFRKSYAARHVHAAR